MRPRSRPMLSTISSVRPRVFIKAPSADESRQLKPLYRAASMAPIHLPTTATTNRINATTQSCQRSSEPICDLEPGDDEEERQQHRDDEVLEPAAHVLGQPGMARHDQADR